MPRHVKASCQASPPAAQGQKKQSRNKSAKPQEPNAAQWQTAGELLPPLDAEAQAALAQLPLALERVRPLSGAHRRSLAEDIAALSRVLTSDRAELKRPYWSRPDFVSAYLYYFLPWNLVRLARLFRGLPLPAPAASQGEALLLDAGAGPLTAALALWLAKPEWRTLPLRVLALDSARQPLELGRALFAAWGEVLGEPVWPVRLERGPLESLAARAWPLASQGARPWLISAANVLNEARPLRRSRGYAAQEQDAGDKEDDNGLDERLERLLAAWSPLLGPCMDAPPDAGEKAAHEALTPFLLFVEPGTRLGGSTLMRLRQLALAGGLSALAPCVSDTQCPLARGAWCHFTFSPQGAPGWLAELAAQAGLAKRSLSLSALLLAQARPASADGAAKARKSASPQARVLSSPFAVPETQGLARYACAACGLALLEDAGRLASGSLVRLESQSPRQRRDARSGARVFAPSALHASGDFKKKS